MNIAAISTRTQALGPGTRAVVWVQGCPLHCPGCIAPDWIPFAPAMQRTPQQVVDQLDFEAISGLTFSGGEPMEQAAALAALAKLARRKKEIDLICFTGYRYERLLRKPPNSGVPALLAEIDVLVDGPYVQSQNDGIGLRGSSNQRIIHLTPRLRGWDFEAGTRKMEIAITDGELAFVGIPTPAMAAALGRVNAELERMEKNERS